MRLLPIAFILILASTTTLGLRYDPFYEKPDSCPPALPVQICSRSCFSDSQCLGTEKCCPTNCGGFICSKPVTMRKAASTEKPGSCPAVPKGRWICSPTCSVDNDCRGTLKCCKNRCGALACQKPEIKEDKFAEFEFVPFREGPYVMPRIPYNNNPRDLSFYP